MVKRNIQPAPTENTIQNPTTYSYVFHRIQPYTTTTSIPQVDSADEPLTESSVQFLLYLSDPSHRVLHTTVTQAVPGRWLGLWDDYDWVEDLVIEAIRVGVEVIGQEYIVSRMSWDKKKEPNPLIVEGEPEAEGSS